MKTTIEIAHAILIEARRVMQNEGRTLRSLFEEGLRLVLAERRRARRSGYKVKPVVVAGRGLHPGIEEGNWVQMRDLIYKGRGT